MAQTINSTVAEFLRRFPTKEQIREALSNNIREAAFLRRALKLAGDADHTRSERVEAEQHA